MANPDPPKVDPPQVGLIVTDVVHAPFIYFDQVPVLGQLPGLITITLSAQRSLLRSDGSVQNEEVAVAYLRCNQIAARVLRDSLDKALLLAMPVEQGSEGPAKN